MATPIKTAVTTSIIFSTFLNYVFADPALLEAFLSGEKNSSTVYCIAYNPLFHKLPTAKESSPAIQLLPFVDLRPWHACEGEKLPKTDPDPVENAILAVSRGNCSFSEKARVAKHQLNANSILVAAVDIDIENFTPSAFNESEYGHINMTVAVTFNSSIEDITKAGYNMATMYKDKPKLVNNLIGLLIIFCLAIFTATVGSVWSGTSRHADFVRAIFRKQHHQDAGDSSSESVSIIESQEQKLTSGITIVSVLVFVIFNCVLLLLLYFYYDYAVYIVIALFCIGALISLHFVLLTLLCKFSYLKTLTFVLYKKKVRMVSVFLFPVCAGMVAWYLVDRHQSHAWILQDFLGIVFCICALRCIRFPNFKILTILLALLFIYDIVFVFVSPLLTNEGDSIMVKVATGAGSKTKETIPLLLKVPKINIIQEHNVVCPNETASGYSLLGFGDILIPGFLISYAHFFDLKVKSGRNIYLVSSVFAYGFALLFTFLALFVMDKGQPALLYIVPSLLLACMLVAKCRKELLHFWHNKQTKMTPSNNEHQTSDTAPLPTNPIDAINENNE